MVVAILTADCHVQRRAWLKRPELHGDAYYSFRQVVDLALRHRVPIIAAGDLIDRRINDQHPIAFLREQLGRLAEAGLRIYHVQGQHEWQEYPWLDSICPEAAVWLPPRGLLEIGPFQVYGIDWTPASQLPEKLAQVPDETDVLVLHQVYSSFSPSPAAELRPEQLPDVRLALIGDTHVTGMLTEVNGNGNQVVTVSPGSLAMQAIDEPGNKYVFLLNDDGSLEKVKLRTRAVLRQQAIRDVPSMMTFLQKLDRVLDELQERNRDLPEELRMPILHIAYDASLPDVRERLLQVTDGKVHLFEKDLSEKAEAEAANAAAQRQELLSAGLFGCLEKLHASKGYPPEVLEYAQELLRNPSMTVIGAWRRRIVDAEQNAAVEE